MFLVVIHLQCVSNSPESVITTQIAEIQCQSANQFPAGADIFGPGGTCCEPPFRTPQYGMVCVVNGTGTENHRGAEGLCSKLAKGKISSWNWQTQEKLPEFYLHLLI